MLDGLHFGRYLDMRTKFVEVSTIIHHTARGRFSKRRR